MLLKFGGPKDDNFITGDLNYRAETITFSLFFSLYFSQ